jgi:hypothetical protein
LTALVFVHVEQPISLGFAAAAAGLSVVAANGWLRQASADAYDSGRTGLARVGPRGDVPVVSKLVEVYTRDVIVRDGRAVLTLRWEATGPGGGLFPALDADITLTPADAGESLLTLDGAYRPPFAALGMALDRVLLHRVATSTVRSLLSQIAASIVSDAAPPAKPVALFLPNTRPAAEPSRGTCLRLNSLDAPPAAEFTGLLGFRPCTASTGSPSR